VKYTSFYIVKRILCVLFSSCMLFGLVACGGENGSTSGSAGHNPPTEVRSPESSQSTYTSDSATTAESIIPTEIWEDPSLVIFRQAMLDTPQLFAAAFFGYVPPDADPFTVMQEAAPQLCEDLPFLLTIDQEHILGVEGQLFCIVPADENATVAINRRPWNEVTEIYQESEVLYRSENGSPILVMCPNDDWIPDTEVIITDSTGNVTIWSPYLDPSYHISGLRNDNGESLIFDFTSYDELPNSGWNQEISSSELFGTWELAWIEVEGDRNAATPDVCTIKITTDETGYFHFTYTNKDFPDENMQNRKLLIVPGELYPGCSNNLWIGEVTEAIGDTIHYALTLLEDGSLLLQTYWEMDGVPMVSYGWYQKID